MKFNLSDFVDYQNSGPTLNFLGDVMRARVQLFVTSHYATN